MIMTTDSETGEAVGIYVTQVISQSKVSLILAGTWGANWRPRGWPYHHLRGSPVGGERWGQS